ncbi:MAG: hypothetical protein WC387_01580 [Candidatus Paceibacterota bacterium]
MKKYLFIALVLSLIILPKISSADSLGVTSITAVKTSALANNSFTDGWQWLFNITVPSGEDNLQMKFLDWTNGALTIPTGGNMRFYSAQSLNATDANSAIAVNSANTYGDNLILDPTKGQQVQVMVEVKIPTGTTGGSYSTSYGIQTTGTTTPSAPILSLKLSDDSPATGTSSAVSNLGVFGIKTKDNTVSWITDLSFNLNIKEGYSPESLLSQNGGEWTSNDTLTFHNLNTRLSQDWHYFTLNNLSVLHPKTAPTFTISATLDASEIKAEDNSGNSLDVSSLDDITSNEMTFIPPPPEEIGTLRVSLNSSNPMASTVFASNNGEVENVSLLAFDVKAENLDISVTDLDVLIQKTDEGTAIATTAFLCEGQTVLGSATVNPTNGTATFSNLNFSIPQDTTKTLTLLVDITSANSAPSVFTASLDGAEMTAIDSNYNTVVPTGSATGNDIAIQSAGAVINLVSSSIGIPVVNPGTGSTTALSGTFNLNFTAVGGDLEEPVASDFVVKATNNPAHTEAITITNLGISVSSPTPSLIADGSSASITLTPILENSQVTESGDYFFYVESIKSTISGQSSITKTTGLESYITAPAPFTK